MSSTTSSDFPALAAAKKPTAEKTAENPDKDTATANSLPPSEEKEDHGARKSTGGSTHESAKPEKYEGTPVDSFEDLDLKETLLRGICAYGFDKPSSIQQKAIDPFIRGFDVLAQAQSGTGKTATFSISLLQVIDESNDFPQAVVISPVRELATQSFDVLTALASYTDVRTLLCVGGTKAGEDARALREKKPHIIVCTPGRAMHLIKEGDLNTCHIAHFVLDEADQLLGHKFSSQVRDIFCSIMRENLHVGLYSATVTQEMESIIPRIMAENRVVIRVQNDMLTLEGIRQYYVTIRSDQDKLETLIDIYRSINITQLMIYTNHRDAAERLVKHMNNMSLPAVCIHGQLEQQERQNTMAEFRNGAARVLVSTDLLARGIDVQQVSMVINYDFPTTPETYLHRIGRSGRYGRKGIAINFVTPRDTDNAKHVEQYFDTQLLELPTLASLGNN